MDKDTQRVSFSAEKPATSHCFSLAKRSLLAAEMQMERIWRPVIKSVDNPSLPYEIILIDIHFYFVALRNLYRYLNKIMSDPVYSHLKADLEILNDKWFRHYSKGREAFEHIDQKFHGEKHEDKIVEIEEKGARRKVHYGLSMKHGVFTHSDESWDISKKSFAEFKDSVAQFIQKIVESSNIMLDDEIEK